MCKYAPNHFVWRQNFLPRIEEELGGVSMKITDVGGAGRKFVWPWKRLERDDTVLFPAAVHDENDFLELCGCAFQCVEEYDEETTKIDIQMKATWY